MASNSSAPVAPLEVISSTDRSGLIVLINTLLLSFVLVCLVVRIFTRVRISGPWMQDDTLVSAATVTCCIQSAVVFYEVAKGMGKTASLIAKDDFLAIGKASFSADVLFIFSLFLSKCSIAFLFLRLTPHKTHSKISWGTIVVSCVWAAAAILAITIECDAAHSLRTFDNVCSNLAVRWEVIVGFDILTELSLFCLSIYLVATLQMAVKNKLIIVIVFGLRLPTIAAAGFRVYYLRAMIASADPTFAGALAVVWMQIEMDYSIISSTLPCLGPFMTPFKNTYVTSVRNTSQRSGTDYALETTFSAASRAPSKGDAKVYSAATVREMPTSPTLDQRLRGDRVSHNASATYELKREEASINSNSSRCMFIRRNTEFSVTHS